MKRIENRILFFIHKKPPFNGVTYYNELILCSEAIKQRLRYDLLPISYGKKINEIGDISINKILIMFGLLFRLFVRCINQKYRYVYFSLVPTGNAFLRDSIFVFLMKLMRKKVIIHIHGVGIVDEMNRSFFRKRLYYSVFKNTDIITLSNEIKKDVACFEKVNSRIHVLNNGIPDLTCSCRENNKKEFDFLLLSNIVRSKGQLIFLNAVKKLRDNGKKFNCIMAGQVVDSQYKKELESFIKKEQLENFIQFRGAIYGDEKDALFLKSCCFVFPTTFESFGIVVLEAMRSGIPSIVSNVYSLPGIINDGETGYLVSPNDPLELAKKMEFILENNNVAKVMGDRARKVFEKKYKFSVLECRFIQLLKNIQGLC